MFIKSATTRLGTILAGGLVLFAISLPTAYAIPIKLDFTVTGFPNSNGNAAPTDLVSGTIVYEAASLGATIDSLTSISLSAGGHSFTLAETSFMSPFFDNIDIIYGSLSETFITNLTSDFEIEFDRVAGAGFGFTYASSGLSGIWGGRHLNFTDFSLARVPEPGTLTLFGLGLAGLGIARRKRMI